MKEESWGKKSQEGMNRMGQRQHDTQSEKDNRRSKKIERGKENIFRDNTLEKIKNPESIERVSFRSV